MEPADIESLISYEEDTIAEREAFMRSLVKESIVDGQELTLQYSTAMPLHGPSDERA
ncbi:MAG: hypothetical protein QGI09_02880 [Dehalococcoidia bacterium]|jgi:hypothetical protein|nr:hypothetical protein [Dehalococcoidia bacterium]